MVRTMPRRECDCRVRPPSRYPPGRIGRPGIFAPLGSIRGCDNRPVDAIVRTAMSGHRQKAANRIRERIMERKKASDFRQELLNLFDQYVHGGITRRQFLDRAQKFAVGGLTAAALLDILKPDYALAVQVPPSDSRIKADRETVQSSQGNGSIKGYFVKPANATGKLPVVLVVHENRGLNPYIEDVARRLAVANFIAFAPDGLTS